MSVYLFNKVSKIYSPLNSFTFPLIFLFILLIKVKSEKMHLYESGSYYYISIRIGSEEESMDLILDTSIPYTIISSPECSICEVKYDNSKSRTAKLLSSSPVEIDKSYRVYTGKIYEDKIKFYYINKYIDNYKYVHFNKITYKTSTNLLGYFSLSYANEAITRTFNLICLEYNNRILDINKIDTDIVDFSKMKNISVIVNNNNTQNEYINDTDDNRNNDNHWYILSNKLTLLSTRPTVTITEDIKLTFDTTSWELSIPKKFFFDNIANIFPENSNCQVDLDGIFICDCDKYYADKYPTFEFYFDENKTIQINPDDYVSYSPLVSRYCYVLINVNYDNDYWITGTNVLNNFYTIFNYYDKTICLYEIKDIHLFYTKGFIWIFMGIALGTTALFLVIYFCYRKCFFNRENNENDNGENNDGRVFNFNLNDFNMDDDFLDNNGNNGNNNNLNNLNNNNNEYDNGNWNNINGNNNNQRNNDFNNGYDNGNWNNINDNNNNHLNNINDNIPLNYDNKNVIEMDEQYEHDEINRNDL